MTNASAMERADCRRVLIVCPRFAPSNAPDMHRVRLALPWLRQFGWSASVLCVKPEFVPAPQDELLTGSIPDDVAIHRTDALPLKWTRALGVGSLSFRALPGLRAAGSRLLDQEAYDLVYISTTEFGVFQLGTYWLKKFNIPYVLDYQDPWITDYYQQNNLRPPGGHFKHGIMQALAKRAEPNIVRKAAHITVVSAAYAQQLGQRYSLPDSRFTVLPFGGASTDFAVAADSNVKNPVFDPRDEFRHWLYAGVAGPYMRKSVTAILLAFRSALRQDAKRFDNIRLHFVGTDYATGRRAQERILPIARDLGIAQYVHEQTDRIPYFQVMRCLLDADALIVPGSNDSGYTASKIYPCVLAKKPLLTVFHESSSVCDIMDRCRCGVSVSFGESSTPEEIAAEVLNRWFFSGASESVPQTDWEQFEPYTSMHMSRTLANVFSHAAGVQENR